MFKSCLFSSHLKLPADWFLRTTLEDEKNISLQQLTKKVQEFKTHFYSDFEEAKKELKKFDSLFTFRKIHDFYSIVRIYFLFLDELLSLHRIENSNASQLNEDLIQFKIEYANFSHEIEQSEEKIKKIKAFNDKIFSYLNLDDSLKADIKKSLDLFVSLLTKYHVGDLQLAAFYERELIKMDWSQLTLHASRFYKGLRSKEKQISSLESEFYPLLNRKCAVIKELHDRALDEIQINLSTLKKLLIDFRNFMDSLPTEFKNLNCSKSVIDCLSNEISAWSKTNGDVFVSLFEELSVKVEEWIHMPSNQELLIKRLEFLKQFNVRMSDINAWLISVNIPEDEINKVKPLIETCTQKKEAVFTFCQIFVLQPSDFLYSIYGFLGKKENSFHALSEIKDTREAYETLNITKLLGSEVDETLFVEKESVSTSRKKKKKSTPWVKAEKTEQSPKSDLSVESKKSEILVTPTIIQVAISFVKTDQVCQKLFSYACESSQEKEGMRFRQAHWHLQQLQFLEETKDDHEWGFSDYVAASSHAAWAIEQTLRAQIQGDAPHPHHLVRLAKAAGQSSITLINDLRLMNYWERYFFSYQDFYKRSTFFYKGRENLSGVLNTIVAANSHSVDSKTLKHKALTLIEETVKWVDGQTQKIKPSQVESKREKIPLEKDFFAGFDAESVSKLKKQFVSQFKNLSHTSFVKQQLQSSFSLLEESAHALTCSTAYESLEFWAIQFIRGSQNLLSGLLEELYFRKTKTESPYHHNILELSKACKVDDMWQPKVFEGLSIKSRYPLQSSSQNLGSQLLNQLESLTLYPEQVTGFSPTLYKRDPWTLPEKVKPNELRDSLLLFWNETIQGCQIILEAFR